MAGVMLGYTLSQGLRNFFSGKTKAERQERRENRQRQRQLERESKLIDRAKLESKIEAIRTGGAGTTKAGTVFNGAVAWIEKNKLYVIGAIVAGLALFFVTKKNPVRRRASKSRYLQLARARAAKARKAKR